MLQEIETKIDKNCTITFISHEDINNIFYSMKIEENQRVMIGYFFVNLLSKNIYFTKQTINESYTKNIDLVKYKRKIWLKIFPPKITIEE